MEEDLEGAHLLSVRFADTSSGCKTGVGVVCSLFYKARVCTHCDVEGQVPFTYK